MAKPLVTDKLWDRAGSLFPKHEPSPLGGAPRIEDRKCLTGILFVLKTGIPWEDLPQEMGCGSGMTCWRRLKEWHEAGVWEKLHQILLDELEEAHKIDFSRAAVDSGSVRAVGGGEKTGPNPTDRRKLGSKHHVLTDANGIPLCVKLTAANRHDVTQLDDLVDDVPPKGGDPKTPRKKPKRVFGDRAYDSEPHRERLRKKGIKPFLAKRGEEHGSGLGVYRWVSERTIGWLHNFRRLRTRFDRSPEIHEAFLFLACGLICLKAL